MPLKTASREMVALFDLSTKGFDIASERRAQEMTGPITIGERALISTSGKLVVTDPSWIKGADYVYDDALGIPACGLGYFAPRPPKIVRGDGFVVFKNLWGDGIFDIYSRGKSSFIQTKNSIDVSPLLRQARKFDVDGWCFPSNRFEGVVGVDSGAIAVIDPSRVALESSAFTRKKIARGQYFTVLDVGAGDFECGFILGGRRFRIRPHVRPVNDAKE